MYADFYWYSGNINTVQAATFESGYYCETVQGTLKADYTVNGTFDEYNQTTSPDDRCDDVKIRVSESLEIPVSINIRRNLNSATYALSVDTTSGWSAAQYCHGDAYEEWEGRGLTVGEQPIWTLQQTVHTTCRGLVQTHHRSRR